MGKFTGWGRAGVCGLVAAEGVDVSLRWTVASGANQLFRLLHLVFFIWFQKNRTGHGEVNVGAPKYSSTPRDNHTRDSSPAEHLSSSRMSEM